MFKQTQLRKAILYTILIVVCMLLFCLFFDAFVGGAISIIAVTPLLTAIFYYGFRWTEKEKKRREDESQLAEKLNHLELQNAQILELLKSASGEDASKQKIQEKNNV